jgi:hypothetical protein
MCSGPWRLFKVDQRYDSCTSAAELYNKYSRPRWKIKPIRIWLGEPMLNSDGVQIIIDSYRVLPFGWRIHRSSHVQVLRNCITNIVDHVECYERSLPPKGRTMDPSSVLPFGWRIHRSSLWWKWSFITFNVVDYICYTIPISHQGHSLLSHCARD